MKIKKESLNDIYLEMSEIVGYENIEKIYEYYKGQIISFPTRLYSRAYVTEVINEQFNGKNAKQLAKDLGYSERWMLKLINDVKKEKDESL